MKNEFAEARTKSSKKHTLENMINYAELTVVQANIDKMMKRLWEESFFNPKTKKWSCKDVKAHDMLLQDYIAGKEEYAKYLSHSDGRNANKKFHKPQCPITEDIEEG